MIGASILAKLSGLGAHQEEVRGTQEGKSGMWLAQVHKVVSSY
jgi:hypothetical protein